LATKKQVVDKLVQLRPMRHQKGLEERDIELYRVREESEKKDADLESALGRLKEADSALQSALEDNKIQLEKWRKAQLSDMLMKRRRRLTRWFMMRSLTWKRIGLLLRAKSANFRVALMRP